jgi:hypothetical protein
MNTIEFDENRHFAEYLVKLLAQGDFKTFQCLIADHRLTLTDFVDLTVNALMPPPDLITYYHAVQRYITTGELQ